MKAFPSDFDILKLSDEEKTLIEEINGVNEAIRLAEWGKQGRKGAKRFAEKANKKSKN